MNKFEKESIGTQREYIVVKSNTLALNARFQYTPYQQKTIAYICSMIKPIKDGNKTKYQLEYKFEISDYLRLLGIEDGGKQYSLIKKTLQSLRDKSMWIPIQDENGSGEVLVGWFSNVAVYSKSGLVKVKIDEYLAPLLFDLKEQYLSYGLYNILNFKSMYSIRFYELLKAHYNLMKAIKRYKKTDTPTIDWKWELDELKHLLLLDHGDKSQPKYKNFKDFRKYVLEAAQRDINTLSDISFEFEPITKGKKTVAIIFYIKIKESIERFITSKNNFDLLNRNNK